MHSKASTGVGIAGVGITGVGIAGVGIAVCTRLAELSVSRKVTSQILFLDQ